MQILHHILFGFYREICYSKKNTWKGVYFMEVQKQLQIYDATLESFFGDEVAAILPALIPGAAFVSGCHIELDRTISKPDLVY
jgi:hypothetical protein